MQEPRIVEIAPRQLVGLSIETSLADSKAKIIWSQLMPRRTEIRNSIQDVFYSVQVYPKGMKMEDFTPTTIFTTRAAIEVSKLEDIPKGFENYKLEGGLYAVFIHKGKVDDFPQLAEYIYGHWIPHSKYKLDERAHFEILGDKFLGPENPESEEEVWIPIKKSY